jgi:hypothetical protein
MHFMVSGSNSEAAVDNSVQLSLSTYFQSTYSHYSNARMLRGQPSLLSPTRGAERICRTAYIALELVS